MAEAKKSLGQHWLNHQPSLQAMIEAADLDSNDTVLEIGPGLGSLTKLIVGQAKQVIAVEVDRELIEKIPDSDNLTLIEGDIRTFDLGQVSPGYKVIANLPYYLTSYVLKLLVQSENSPKSVTVLVQKEVAERIAAKPGKLSILALSLQIYGEAKLGPVVKAELFEPPPKVDSQVVSITSHHKSPIESEPEELMRLIKIGFSAKRKTLINNLSAGLQKDKAVMEEVLSKINVDSNARAQELTLSQWDELYSEMKEWLET